jgi:glycosyltransferase involved in cell wall biosynthesis
MAKKMNLKLKIAGTGNNKDTIDQVKSMCNNKIEFLGVVNGQEKKDLLSGAKALFMIGSILDACPLTSIEAWASGTPVIARSVGVHPEIVTNDVGFLCNTDSDISRAILNIEKIDKKKCYNYVVDKFSHTNSAKEYVEIYEKISKGLVS